MQYFKKITNNTTESIKIDDMIDLRYDYRIYIIDRL